jgi:CBS domain-containing protein
MPVHTWPQPSKEELEDCRQNYRTVRQIMSTSLVTVHPEDIVDYVASIMHWEHLRYVPVEDMEGRLVGLVSQRNLLLLLAQGSTLNRAQGVPVSAVMKRDLITVSPDTPTTEAIQLMRHRKIGCLPVVERGRLVGVLTLFELLTVSANLLELELSKS